MKLVLKFHADTAASFSQINKTLKLTIPWYLCMIWRHLKVFTKCFLEKLTCPVIWWATRKENPARFLEAAILCEEFCGNFKRKLSSSPCYHMISVRSCFCVCICLMFWCIYLAYGSFCAMLFSVFHLSKVNIFCCLYYVPGVYLKCPMLCLRCGYCPLFSEIC